MDLTYTEDLTTDFDLDTQPADDCCCGMFDDTASSDWSDDWSDDWSEPAPAPEPSGFTTYGAGADSSGGVHLPPAPEPESVYFPPAPEPAPTTVWTPVNPAPAPAPSTGWVPYTGDPALVADLLAQRAHISNNVAAIVGGNGTLLNSMAYGLGNAISSNTPSPVF